MPRRHAVAKADKLTDADTRKLVGEPLLTVEQVAQLLSCSASNLNKWRLKGEGPSFVRVGANIRYRPADIQSFIAENMSTSTSEDTSPAA